MRRFVNRRLAVVAAAALSFAVPTSAAAEVNAVALAVRIAEAVSGGHCPASSDLAAVADLYRAGPADSLRVVYEELHDRVQLRGVPYGAIWQAATTPGAANEASEAMRALTACFGVPEFTTHSYKAMLDTITAYIDAAAASATVNGEPVRPSEIGMFVTTTREILSGLPGRKTAHLSVQDSLTGDFEATVEAAGQYDGEDIMDSIGGPSQSSVAHDPVTAASATGSRASAVVGNLLLGRDKTGYTRVSERVYVHDWLSGITLFTIDNTITWHWNYTERYVSDGQAFHDWDMRWYSHLNPYVRWEFHDWKRNQAGFDDFANGQAGKGEWFQRLTAIFRYGFNSPWGDYVLAESWPYANLYGHFDGFWSNYEGDTRGYPTDYCVGRNIEDCR